MTMWPRLVAERPYSGRQQVLDLFVPFRQRPGAILLDSGGSTSGRFDLISTDPVASLVTRGEHSVMQHGEHALQTERDPFAILRDMWQQHRPPEAALAADKPALPFSGGLLGAFSYDLGRRIENLPQKAAQDLPFAELYAGIYHWAIIVDHQRQHCGLWQFAGVPQAILDQARDAFLTSAPEQLTPFRLRSAWQSNLSRSAYGAAFRRVQEYIRAGDCYQINLAQRYSAPASGDPYEAYRRLSPRNRAPFSAYLATADGAILSLSPERFIAVEDRHARTEPIKGTRRRDVDPQRDQALADELLASEKDRAENVMIVDLLRNDFGKSCTPGSVRVPELFALRSYPAVHHMVSTVTGEIASGEDAIGLLRGCFPGGSITGAPKVRAMEIIDELEPQRRSFYCGSIGYYDYRRRFDSSIAIRTLLYSGDRIHAWGGGGLIADSDEQAEYEETLAKISRLLPVLSEPDAGI